MEVLWPQAASPAPDAKKIYGLPDSQLDRLRPCIRILRLLPGAFEDPIECTLQAACLDDEIVEYEAISYAWGDASITSPILVNREKFNVTVNLKEALQYLRLPDCERLLWADAICIDQSSFEEKISHLDLMSRLYREAKQVHIWLGQLTSSWMSEAVQDKHERIDWAFNMEDPDWQGMEAYLHRSLHESFNNAGLTLPVSIAPYEEILDPDSPLEQLDMFLEVLVEDVHFSEFPFYGLGEDRIMTPCTGADEDEDENEVGAENLEFNMNWLKVARILLWILSRPWWNRVWTLQELLLPCVDPIVHVGTWICPTTKLFDALDKIQKHQTTCCKSFGSIWFGEYSRTIARLIDSAQGLGESRQEVQEGKHYEPAGQMLSILESSRRQATDIRDHVYGILGLMGPSFSMFCQHKAYRLTAVGVFTRATKLMFCSSGSLDKLSFASGSRTNRLPGLPSWAIDFRHVLEDHDTLSSGEPYCRACPNSAFDGHRLLYDLQGPTLCVRGIHIGTIGSCAKPVNGGDLIPFQIRSMVEEAMEMYDTAAKNPSSYDENRFWRTVLRDSTFDKYEPEKLHPPVTIDFIKRWWEGFREGFTKFEASKDSTGLKEREEGDESGEEHWLAVSVMLAKTLFTSWMKRLFFCTQNGEPGLGPKEMGPSDEIYALAGFQGLLVLRRRSEDSNSSQNAKQSFTVKGSCYMDGFMEGQAVRDEPEWEDLTLY